MRTLRSSLTFALLLALTVTLAPVSAPVAAAPEGQVTFAVTVTLAPTWFDPAETPGVITPFLTLYALHDALVKPMPGNAWAASLAESWTASKDGLTYEFVLRKGVRFHNGDPVTAEDVKFSFERYKGGGATTLKARVAAVEIIDPNRIRFRMKQPWPDFMTFYGTPATSAGWIVPKKYLERVGDDGFKESAGRRGAVSLRVVQPRRRAGARGVRRLLAKDPGRQAPRAQIGAGRVDVEGDPAHGLPVARLHRAVGPEVAVGGSTRPARALFRDQAVEMDRKRREALLHKIQQLMHERAMFGPIIEQAALTGVGPRLADVPTITGHPFVSPYEDLELKGR